MNITWFQYRGNKQFGPFFGAEFDPNGHKNPVDATKHFTFVCNEYGHNNLLVDLRNFLHIPEK